MCHIYAAEHCPKISKNINFDFAETVFRRWILKFFQFMRVALCRKEKNLSCRPCAIQTIEMNEFCVASGETTISHRRSFRTPHFGGMTVSASASLTIRWIIWRYKFSIERTRQHRNQHPHLHGIETMQTMYRQVLPMTVCENCESETNRKIHEIKCRLNEGTHAMKKKTINNQIVFFFLLFCFVLCLIFRYLRCVMQNCSFFHGIGNHLWRLRDAWKIQIRIEFVSACIRL